MPHTRARVERYLAHVAVATLAVGLLGSRTSGASQGNWLRIGDPPNSPAFSQPAAVYDSVADRVLVYQPFRYSNGSAAVAADIWEFQLGHPEDGWRMLETSGTPPLGRASASAVFDRPNQRLLLFGGFPALGGTNTNELFQLSLAGLPTWSIVPAVTDTLRIRLGAFMCIDESTRQLVLYGGNGYFGDHWGPMADLWALPLDALPIWTNVPV